MRRFGRFLILAVLIWHFTGSSILAMTVAAEGKVTLTGVVPPMKSIAVNEDGVITRIFSNSDTDGSLMVYKDEGFTSLIGITLEIQRQYDELKTSHDLNKYGEVYNLKWQPELVIVSRANNDIFGINVFQQPLGIESGRPSAEPLIALN